jgi:hypothetical protein
MRNLTTDEREEKRQQLTRALETLMEDLCRGWSEEEQPQIREFIDNYEFGLALELLAAVMVKHAKSLTIEQLRKIDALAQQMGMSGSEYLRDLHAYAGKLGLKGASAGPADPT